MPTKPTAPVTLGEKLPPTAKVALAKAVPRTAKPEIALWRVGLWSCCLGFLVWLATGNLLIGIAAGGIGGGALLILRRPGKAASPSKRRSGKTHMLLAADKQGFMKNLRLADKTALFDGSNIYHFGMDNNIGPTALWALANSLRSEAIASSAFSMPTYSSGCAGKTS